jgi:Flp pilus assembly protein TadG
MLNLFIDHTYAMLIKRLFNDRRGAVAPMFALAIIPLIGAVGSAVDYSMAAKVRAQLIAAADSASIGSVSRTSPALAAAANMGGDGAVPGGSDDAAKIFKAHLTTQNGYTLTGVTATVTKTGTNLSSKVDFTADVPTHFMGFFGVKTLAVRGSATASNNMPLFVDFYLLLDNTPSMGVGATTTDINKMMANTPDKCAFACHDQSDPNNYYNLAKTLGVSMRIDVMRTATQQLMDTAKTTALYSNQFRMAIYTFGASAKKAGLTELQSLTSNLTTAKSAASGIDLMSIPYQNYQGDTQTNLPDVLKDIKSDIPKPGDGSSSSSPLKYLFFVSDGVADRVNGSPGCSETTTTSTDPQTGKSYTRCQEPLDVSFCDDIKKKNVKIAVLYTTYLPLPTNSWYMKWISPFASQIAKNMEACASPGLYFEVSPSQGISEAMTALFKKAVSQARLAK